MKSIKINEAVLLGFTRLLALLLVAMLIFISASATEKKEIKPLGNQLPISEFDFRQMILDKKVDTMRFRLDIGKHLLEYQEVNYDYEFKFIAIPFGRRSEGINREKKRLTFKKRRIRLK